VKYGEYGYRLSTREELINLEVSQNITSTDILSRESPADDRLKSESGLGKPVTTQIGKLQAVTTLCRFQCGVAVVYTL